ncbi:MAG: transporter substrate-binding domain-containing protein [Firmicutes bacterium]|nr:transporter substrate-binding domain-containing protein [Bacillota bacterium]
MKKKYISALIFILLIILLSINLYINKKYDINLIQYISYSKPLSLEERSYLKEHGSLIYGADQNAPPLRYVDNEDGQYKGAIVDYIKTLSIEIGEPIEIKPLVWEKALSSLAKGKTDICDMFKSKEREKYYLFSKPFYNLRGVILTKKSEDNIKNYKDLINENVAVPKGDYAIEFLKKRSDKINFIFTKDIKRAIKLLKSGKVKAVVGDEPVVSYFVNELNLEDKTKIVNEPLYEKEVVFAVPKSEEKLIRIINKGIFNLKRKGVIQKIQQKWFGISVPISNEGMTEKVVIISAIFAIIYLGITYLFYSWNRTLKKEVKKRTEELYMSRNDLQTTFDGLTHFMIVFNKDYKIVNVNKAFCNFVNKKRENIIGKKDTDFIDMNEIHDIIKNTYINKKRYNKKIKYENRIYEISSFPLKDKEQKIIKVLLMVKDVTNIKIQEKKLMQANKMVAVGQLAAGVAHEIRNPLGLIRNYTYLLKMKFKNIDDSTKKAIKSIESSVDKASDIIDNLLNFSRISGTDKKKIHLKSFVDNILQLERKVMEKQKIDFKAISDDIDLEINQESLKHIIINLISNAIDAMPDGGKLTLKCIKNGNSLFISCSDTGIGISESDLENIFDPFFTNKGLSKGTGLGLYVLYNQVEKSGGEIKVNSKLDKGTTFEIYLPLKGEVENDK